LGKKAFLVADDDTNRLESVRGLLQSEGYIVDTAVTGREVIEKSQAGSYNLALLALRLAEKEGPEFLIQMRKSIPRSNTIIVTGDSTSEDASSSLSPGPEGYVTEPFDPENLLKLVEEKLKEQAEVELYRSVIPWTSP